MIRLENVMDIRNGQIYSVVICKKRLARFFVPAPEPEEEEEAAEE